MAKKPLAKAARAGPPETPIAKPSSSAAELSFENSLHGRQNITDHVCYALAAAADAIRLAKQAVEFEALAISGPTVDVAQFVVAMLHRVAECVVATNPLAQAEVAELFRSHYASPLEPVAGQSGASFHEIGRNLAIAVQLGCWAAADPVAAHKAWGINGSGERFDESLIARNWLPTVLPSGDTALVVNHGVRDWLANKSPTFDCSRLISNIQNEATRANRRFADAAPTDYLFSTSELAALAGVNPKTFSNVLSEASKIADVSKRPPKPKNPRKGNRPASFSYAAIRPWLLLKWPGRQGFFPESRTEARREAERLMRDG